MFSGFQSDLMMVEMLMHVLSSATSSKNQDGSSHYEKSCGFKTQAPLKERKVISRNPERVLKIVSPKIGMIKAKTTLIVLRKYSSWHPKAGTC